VRGIVERHQGQVSVESHGRDGTTFWVKLPRVLLGQQAHLISLIPTTSVPSRGPSLYFCATMKK
jgi:hypothetical protein